MKKSLTLAMITLLCFILTGCYGTVMNINIKSDGSGIINWKIGFSEMAYEMMKTLENSEQSQESSVDEEKLEDLKPFYHNGKIYYGSEKSMPFSSIEEFNKNMSEFNEEEEISSGVLTLAKNSDSMLNLKLDITSETANTQDSENTMESLDISEEQINILMQDMVMIFTVDMPGKVTQIEGDGLGITINDNILEIDFLKLNLPKQEDLTKTYSFNCEIGKYVEEKMESKFSDVPLSLWSCKAINILAEGGLVSGVGYGRFSPERGMKISEFCQVLANATGLESGPDENGYWAAKAIQNCIDKGYIYTHGEINMQNYDQVITREEAIAAMQIAGGGTLTTNKNITLEDIPDGTEISDKYKLLIVQAYNSGITTGVNEQLKFSPKNKLTRGQVCQLFYNLNWTKPFDI